MRQIYTLVLTSLILLGACQEFIAPPIVLTEATQYESIQISESEIHIGGTVEVLITREVSIPDDSLKFKIGSDTYYALKKDAYVYEKKVTPSKIGTAKIYRGNLEKKLIVHPPDFIDAESASISSNKDCVTDGNMTVKFTASILSVKGIPPHDKTIIFQKVHIPSTPPAIIEEKIGTYEDGGYVTDFTFDAPGSTYITFAVEGAPYDEPFPLSPTKTIYLCIGE